MAYVLVMLFSSDSRDDCGRAHSWRAARIIYCLLGNNALSHASDVQRGRRSLPQRPRADRGPARGATPDAETLAKNMVKQLPASRHGEAGEAIAEAFLVEAKMQK